MKHQETLTATFKELAESFAQLVEGEGIIIRPYADPKLIHFNRLSPDEQVDVISRVKTYVLAFVHMKEKHQPLTDTRAQVETYLNTAGYNSRPEDLDLIENDHFIEIYNRAGMHLFRSLNILEISSYTFEDLCCRQWHHLYERPGDEQEKIILAAAQYFQLENPVRQETGLKPFRIIEKDSLERLIYNAETKWFIPVFKADSFAAVLTIVVNRNKNPIPQYFHP
ncbi:hypothetical protein [Bdellovibrio sp. HCB288]|uniref:hypothetical protein n=1 Tax=Bdellovibrio sp. HCB288 TaxID=3394355 RepID=UPI0039B616B8